MVSNKGVNRELSRLKQSRNSRQAFQKSKKAAGSELVSSEFSRLSKPSRKHVAQNSATEPKTPMQPNPSFPRPRQTQLPKSVDNSQGFLSLLTKTPQMMASRLAQAFGFSNAQSAASEEFVSQFKSNKSPIGDSTAISNEIVAIRPVLDKALTDFGKLKEEVCSGDFLAKICVDSVPFPEFLQRLLEEAVKTSNERHSRLVAECSKLRSSVNVLFKVNEYFHHKLERSHKAFESTVEEHIKLVSELGARLNGELKKLDIEMVTNDEERMNLFSQLSQQIHHELMMSHSILKKALEKEINSKFKVLRQGIKGIRTLSKRRKQKKRSIASPNPYTHWSKPKKLPKLRITRKRAGSKVFSITTVPRSSDEMERTGQSVTDLPNHDHTYYRMEEPFLRGPEIGHEVILPAIPRV